MDNDLIDIDQENESPNDLAMNLIRWWERWRLPYNIFVIVIQGALLFLFISKHSYGTRHFPELLIFSLIYLFILNLCFCLGWGVPLLFYHYFKLKPTSKSSRIVLLILGTILTFILTLLVYSIVT